MEYTENLMIFPFHISVNEKKVGRNDVYTSPTFKTDSEILEKSNISRRSKPNVGSAQRKFNR
jgi:hypothetical protein